MPSQDQRTAVRYFNPKSGCPGFIIEMISGIKDEVYDQMLMSKLKSLNLRQKAISRIGLDEDELKEIPPIFLHGFRYGDGALARTGKDGRYRSSKYDVAWLFFSSTQVYMYSYTFDMLTDSKREETDEYFYKDILSFTSVSETMDVPGPIGCTGTPGPNTMSEYNMFQLSTAAGKFRCSISGVADADRSISAMKQKLREKKG